MPVRSLRRTAGEARRWSPSPRSGRVYPREIEEVDEDEIRGFCRERIAHFKVPRYVKQIDELPMTVTGKVQQFKLREAAIEELGLEEPATS